MKYHGKAAAMLLACLLFSGSAEAADLVFIDPPPAPPPADTAYDWTGLYIGVQGGYGWANLEEAGGFDLFLGRDSIDLRGGFAGVHAGYNAQWDRFVLGIEGDINKAWMSEDFVWGMPGVPIPGVLVPPVPEIGTAAIDWFGSLRARLGYTWDRTLLFGTAGAAIAGVSIDLPAVALSDSENFIGWTAGLGIEHAFEENWLARAEYRYYDFGGGRFFEGTGFRSDLDLTMHTLSVGLTYKF